MTHLERGEAVHKALEACLAVIEIFRVYGVKQTIQFAQDTSGCVGLKLDPPTPSGEEFLIPLGDMKGLSVEAIEAQWQAVAKAYQRNEFSPVQLKIMMEMYVPQQKLLLLTCDLVKRGYELPGLNPTVLEAIKKDLGLVKS